MSTDDKSKPNVDEASAANFERRSFLKILGVAFSTAALPEMLAACSDDDDARVSHEIEALTPRQTISVVRPEDLLVLTIGFVNLRRAASGDLTKLAPAAPAYLIVGFPPQAIAEDAIKDTDGLIPPDFFASAWLGGGSRLIFQLPQSYGTTTPAVPYSLSAILGLCAVSSIVVTDPMKQTIATTVDAPVAPPSLPAGAPSVPAFVSGKVANLTAASDPTASALKMQAEGTMAPDGTIPALQGWQQPYAPVSAQPQGVADGSVSLIEIPYRLQLSPSNVAGWSHAKNLVQGKTGLGAPGAYELWHTVLGARTVPPGVAGLADERNAYLRTARALWTRDLDSGVAACDSASMSPYTCTDNIAWNPAPYPAVPLKRPSLQANQRLRIVQLTTQGTPVGRMAIPARPIQVNRLMLSALGGHFDAHAEFNDPTGIVNSWVHRMAGGRESYVQVVSTGVILPFGNVATKIHITKRNEDPKKGAIGTLYTFDILIIRNPVTGFRAADLATASAQTALLQWPFISIELKQTRFVTQQSSARDYWAVDLSGTPILVPAVGYDQRGKAIRFSVPLYFVDPVAWGDPSGRDVPVQNYRNALFAPAIATPRTAPFPSIGSPSIPVVGRTSVESMSVPMGGQRIAYAYSKRDDTTFATRTLYFDLAPAPGEKFPYVPVVTGALVDVESLHSYTDGQPVTVVYHPAYATSGLDPAANKSQLLFRLVDPSSGAPVTLSADFRNRPDGGTGFVAPSMKFQALSRTTGPTHDPTSSAPLARHALRAMDTAGSLGDGGFNPSSYLGLAASELDKLRLFGVFSLLDIIKAVDPAEASGDLAGLAASAEQAALKYAPRYLAEGLSDLERLISTIAEVKSQVESVWANAKELLGDAVNGGTLNGTLASAQSIVVQTATGLVNKTVDDVRQQIMPVVTAAQAFYKTLLAAIGHIENLEVGALAGLPAPPDGSLPQLLQNGKALRDAIAALASYGARAALKAKGAIVAASNTIPKSSGRKLLPDGTPADPTQLTNACIQIAQGLQNTLSRKLDNLNAIIAVLADIHAVTALFDDAKQALSSLRDMTVKIEWQPKIGSYYLPGTDWMVFRPATQHALTLDMEARAKAQNGKSAGVDVSCRLDHFDLCLGPLDSEGKPVIGVQFDHISFEVQAGKKPDVDVKINGMVFGGPLSFLDTLRKIIPLDGFSDPPYLNVDASGIHAGFTFQVPNVAVGIFSLENIAIRAKLEIPFFTDGGPVSALTFTFSFCDKDHPFLITVSLLGGGGYFVVSLTPRGIEMLEVSISVGACISISLLGIAQGSVSILAGITFTVTDVKNAKGDSVGKDVSLTAFLRLHGELDVLGIISISVDLSVSMTYDFTHKTMIAEAWVKVDVSILFFSMHVSLPFRKEFHSCNNDPTLRQLMPPVSDFTNSPGQSWSEYCGAYAA